MRFPDILHAEVERKTNKQRNDKLFFLHSACNHDQYIQMCVLKGWLGTLSLASLPKQKKSNKNKKEDKKAVFPFSL